MLTEPRITCSSIDGLFKRVDRRASLCVRVYRVGALKLYIYFFHFLIERKIKRCKRTKRFNITPFSSAVANATRPKCMDFSSIHLLMCTPRFRTRVVSSSSGIFTCLEKNIRKLFCFMCIVYGVFNVLSS